MDEQPVQLLDDKILPIPIKPGSVRKEDYEYIRKGSASIFLFTEPLKGWRHVKASEQRTRKDWALQIQELLTVQYKDVKKIRRLRLAWPSAWKYTTLPNMGAG